MNPNKKKEQEEEDKLKNGPHDKLLSEDWDIYSTEQVKEHKIENMN